MIEIRNVTFDDLDALHAINRAVSSNPNKTAEQWQLAYYKYVDYYPICEPENSFVITDDGKPFGYILCSTNIDHFISGMEKHFKNSMNQLQEGSFESFIEGQAGLLTFKDNYPAHLHIDVLPEYQNVHAGSRLMNHLLDHLKKNNICGICLGVSATRPQAIHFYIKNHFEILENESYGYIMGQKLL